MTNEEIKALEPEFLKQFNVDWKFYKPAGGWTWYNHFRSTLVPSIERKIAKVKQLKAAREGLATQAEKLIRDLADSHTALSGVGLLIASGLAIKTLRDDSGEIKAWLNAAPKMINEIVSAIAEERDTSGPEMNADVEISYLEALRDYFNAVLELDMTLWAMRDVDIKYRTKIFRMAYKMLDRVNAIRFKVESVDCKMRQFFEKAFAQPVADLHLCYEGDGVNEDPMKRIGLTKLLRKEKKALDKQGNSYWLGSNSVASLQNKQNVSAEALGWEIAS